MIDITLLEFGNVTDLESAKKAKAAKPGEVFISIKNDPPRVRVQRKTEKKPPTCTDKSPE